MIRDATRQLLFTIPSETAKLTAGYKKNMNRKCDPIEPCCLTCSTRTMSDTATQPVAVTLEGRSAVGPVMKVEIR